MLTFPGIRLTATPNTWTVLSYLTFGFLCVCKLTMLCVFFPSPFFFLSPRTHIKVKKYACFSSAPLKGKKERGR